MPTSPDRPADDGHRVRAASIVSSICARDDLEISFARGSVNTFEVSLRGEAEVQEEIGNGPISESRLRQLVQFSFRLQRDGNQNPDDDLGFRDPGGGANKRRRLISPIKCCSSRVQDNLSVMDALTTALRPTVQSRREVESG